MENNRKVALITGAAQGIGRRTAELLAAHGYSVVLSDLKPASGTLAQIHAEGGEAIDAPGDITEQTTMDRLFETVNGRFGQIDVLVNNAGISLIRRAEETTAEDWRRILNVNLVAPFLLCQAFGRMMLDQGQGSIINVASIAGLFGVADRSAYNASKHGLIGLTRTLAAEWGGFGVRCNAVCPGWVKTEMDQADRSSGSYDDADIENRVPMGRFALPDDIAQAVLFLAQSETSGFINGQTLVVDGGWTADATWESLRLTHR